MEASSNVAVLSRLFPKTGPLCWVRRPDTARSRVCFDNLATGLSEMCLPIEVEYTIAVPPQVSDEPLGIALEPNFSGIQRFGWRSGRRGSGTDSGAVIRKVDPRGVVATAAAAQPHLQRLRPGHHLIAVNGASVLGLTFAETIAAIRTAGRPALLRFHDPYAVTAQLSSLAADVSTPASVIDEAVITVRTHGARGRLLQRGLSSAASTRLAMEAQAEARVLLDLSLDSLKGMSGDAATDAVGSTDAVDSAAWSQATSDPAVLRLLTAAVTGSVANVADSAAEEALRRRHTTSGGTGGGDPAAPKAAAPRAPATSNETATRALSVLASFASVGTGGASLAPPRAAALAMASCGVLARTLESVGGSRASCQPFSEAAVSTVGLIVQSHGLIGANGGGFSRASAVALQSFLRTSSSAPTAEALQLLQALSRAYPDQDSAAFLGLVEVRVKVTFVPIGAGVRSTARGVSCRRRPLPSHRS